MELVGANRAGALAYLRLVHLRTLPRRRVGTRAGVVWRVSVGTQTSKIRLVVGRLNASYGPRAMRCGRTRVFRRRAEVAPRSLVNDEADRRLSV